MPVGGDVVGPDRVALHPLRQQQGEGVVAAQMGQWAAPFGITLVADTLAAVMVVLGAITGFAVAIYSLADIDAVAVRARTAPAGRSRKGSKLENDR